MVQPPPLDQQPPSALLMKSLVYFASVLSTLYRLGSYVFLRIIPASHLTRILPVLYIGYLSTLYVTLPLASPRTEESQQKGPDDSKVTQQAKDAPRKSQTSLVNTVTTLLLSIPSPARHFNFTNVLINTVLAILFLDFVFYPLVDNAENVTFTRIGAVYPDSVKLVVRYPLENATEHQLRIIWRQLPENGAESTWSPGPALTLTPENDWVQTALLDGLWPTTSYEYMLGTDDGVLLSYPKEPIRFHTFPDPRLPTGSHFRFVASSCATPNFPYRPLHGRRIKGFDLLADYLWPSDVEDHTHQQSTTAHDFGSTASSSVSAHAEGTDDRPKSPVEFLLFLGDFIYADVPLYHGDNVEAYRRLYRRNYQSESFRKIYERLPIFHAYDDHEIINNFVGQGNDSIPPFANASSAFRIYNAHANYDPREDGQHYYDFRFGDVAFFVMDTRRYRSSIENDDAGSRTMLGDRQLSALYQWLEKVNNTATFKFIATSVPFTSLWQHDALKDSWAAYSYEKTALLNALHSVPNVILLSGDRHEFAAIKFNHEGQGHNVMEVSTSPLSMFYIPFVRTLRMASKNVVRATKSMIESVDIEKEGEAIPQEEVVKYIPQGNYKWSTFEVDTRDLDNPVVHVEVVIDGTIPYRLTIAGKPVEFKSTTALGTIVPSGIKGVLDKIGLKPNRWF